MSRMTGGELLVETLRDHGVVNVFSIIGGQMCSIYDALSRRPEMKLVTLRNEAAAPMMAAGCTAVTGVPSVSMCTVGAGVVYEVAGLLAAWYSYLPVISIAPQVQSWKMNPHQENLQGLDQHGIFQPITKWNAIIYHWERIPALTHRAIREALANAPGPVHLDAPVDVLFQARKLSDRKKAAIMPPAASTRYSGSLPGPKEKVEKAVQAMARAEKPLVMVGQAMGRPGRWPDLKDHLNKLGIPVMTGDCSSGIMNGNDPCHLGQLGLFAGSEHGLESMSRADLIIVIGLDDQIRETLEATGKDHRAIVQVEVDPSAIMTGRRDFIGVNADPISFLTAAGKAAWSSAKWEKWLDEVQKAGAENSREISERMPGPASLLEGVAKGLTQDDVVVVDGADTVTAARACFRAARYRNLFLMNTRDMAGTGLPFAIGAKIGIPDKKVTLITDRDSLMRHVQELQTAAGLGVGIFIICVDPGEGDGLARTEAILAGLGCETTILKAGESPQPAPPKTLRTWLFVNDSA